eukprot:g11894.t1
MRSQAPSLEVAEKPKGKELQPPVTLFSNDRNWWHYRLVALLHLTTFFFCFASGFLNVVFLVDYGVFASLPSGNLIRLGAAIVDRLTSLKEMKRELTKQEFRYAKTLNYFGSPLAGRGEHDWENILALIAAFLAYLLGAGIAIRLQRSRPRRAGLILAAVCFVLQLGIAMHFHFVVLKPDKLAVVPRALPISVLLGGVLGGVMNVFTQNGPLKMSNIFMGPLLMRLSMLIVDLCSAPCCTGPRDEEEACFAGSTCCCPRRRGSSESSAGTATATRTKEKVKERRREQGGRAAAGAPVESAHGLVADDALPCYSLEVHVVAWNQVLLPFPALLAGVVVAAYFYTLPRYAFSWWPRCIQLVASTAGFLIHDLLLLRNHRASGDILTPDEAEKKARKFRDREGQFDAEDGPHSSGEAEDEDANGEQDDRLAEEPSRTSYGTTAP